MCDKKRFKAEELVKELTQEALQGGEFSLNDAIIVGKLDLSKWSKVLSTFEPVSGDWLVVSGDSPITVSSVNKRA